MEGGSLVRYPAACMAGGEVVLVDLVKRFADVTAVAGINLDMPPGEFFSLLGPSGGGMPTTSRCVAGFQPRRARSPRPPHPRAGRHRGGARARPRILTPAVLLLDEPLGALDAKLRKA